MRANTQIEIIRGSRVETSLGDFEDLDRVVSDKIPAFIRDSYTRRDKHSGASTDNDAQCRVPFGTNIQVGDRIVSHEGQAYLVRGRQKVKLVGKDILLDLERISGNMS